MSIDINLVNKITSEGSKDVRIKKIRSLSFGLLFFVGFLSLIIFLVNFRFSVNYVKKQQNDLIADLSVYDKTTAKILLLNARLENIGSILNQRKKYNETADLIVKGTTPSITIQDFQINDSGISMQISSSSLLELNDFLNYILSLSKSKTITSVTLESLTSQPSGYLMSVKAN